MCANQSQNAEREDQGRFEEHRGPVPEELEEAHGEHLRLHVRYRDAELRSRDLRPLPDVAGTWRTGSFDEPGEGQGKGAGGEGSGSAGESEG